MLLRNRELILESRQKAATEAGNRFKAISAGEAPPDHAGYEAESRLTGTAKDALKAAEAAMLGAKKLEKDLADTQTKIQRTQEALAKAESKQRTIITLAVIGVIIVIIIIVILASQGGGR